MYSYTDSYSVWTSCYAFYIKKQNQNEKTKKRKIHKESLHILFTLDNHL